MMDKIRITYPIFQTYTFETTCNLPDEFDSFDNDELADFVELLIDKDDEIDPAHGLSNAFEVGYAKVEVLEAQACEIKR
jgi:hypothetical protein